MRSRDPRVFSELLFLYIPVYSALRLVTLCSLSLSPEHPHIIVTAVLVNVSQNYGALFHCSLLTIESAWTKNTFVPRAILLILINTDYPPSLLFPDCPCIWFLILIKKSLSSKFICAFKHIVTSVIKLQLHLKFHCLRTWHVWHPERERHIFCLFVHRNPDWGENTTFHTTPYK